MRRQWYLLAEFTALFLVLPAAMWVLMRTGGVRLPVIPALWLVSALCLVLLLVDPTFDRRRLYAWGEARRTLPTILLRFVLLAGVLWGMVAILKPALLFGFVKSRPGFWAIIMVAYPILSVYPQSIVYRAFVFHRYRSLMPIRWVMIACSAAAFAFSHILFNNLWAVGLTLVGGVLFARTYERTDSLMVSWLEHALFGDFVFTVGLGVFLYHGTTALLLRAAGQ